MLIVTAQQQSQPQQQTTETETLVGLRLSNYWEPHHTQHKLKTT